MILENSDKLKDWLSVVLEPLCDADSSALARYVIALLKKDKSDKDLKRIMIEQLDVFLSEETTRFVERLFDAIASEEYLTMPHPLPTLPAVPAATSVSELDLGDELALAIDGAADIEAVLAAASPPPAKENVIKVEKQQLTDEQRPDAVAQESINLASDSTTDATTSTKPPVDHKTKDPSCPQPQSQLGSAAYHHHPPSHHQHHQVPRSASPPGRSSGGGSGGGPGPAAGYADKENQPRDGRRRRASLRSRSRSRSRSNERNFRRSRSRDRRINEREKNQRQFRNKSPPGHGSNHGRRNFDRRRIGGGGGSGGIGGGGSGGGNNIEERQRFGQKSRRSHSRSLSPERNSRRPQSSPERGGGLSSIATGNSMEPQHPAAVVTTHIRQRCRDFDEKGYCVRGETCPWDHGINPVVFEGINNSALMMSMREYNPDAPEIWARGGGGGVAGGPPGPPGPNVAGPTPSGVQGVPVSINPFSGNVRPNALMTPNHPMGVPNPSDYARPPGPPGPQGPTMMPFPFNPTAVTTPLQRQLIPIPVVDAGGAIVGGAGGGGGAPPSGGPEMGKRRFELEDTVAIADVPTKRKVPINSRLGPRVNPNMQQHNSSLELRKVPRGLNTIAHLNNHFAKFGKIVNIQVSYEGDPEAAIVTFSTHAEANVAYRSTEAVLNNRFIKVFWHNGVAAGGLDESQGNALTSGIGSNAPGGRKNASQYHLHNVPAVPTPIADGAKISNAGTTPLAEHAGAGGNQATAPTEQALAVAPASMRLKLNTATTTTTTSSNGGNAGLAAPGTGNAATPRANAATLRKKQEEQQKAMHQLANGLRKRKQELLQSYVKQMKTALELVERMDQQDAQRAPTLETIKVLQETIDKLRKDVHADQDQLQAQIQQQQIQPSVKKTKEQQKKELLDMELELFAQQQEGNDTTALQKRLEELQRTLSAGGGGGVIGGVLNSNNPKASGPTGGGAAARKRANFPEGSTRVDRRPKAIVVTGFAAEEADFVLGHFKNFGEILKHDVDREIPQLILSYATRINAEQAVLRGKMYKEKRLQISWAPVVTTTTPAVAAPMAAPADKSPAVASVDNNLNNTTNPKQLIQSVSESESLLGSDTLPELRLEDEEEDEESEDRSWRR